MTRTMAIELARRDVHDRQTWSQENSSWWICNKPAGAGVYWLRDRRVHYALNLLGVDFSVAKDYVDGYGPGSFTEMVRGFE